MEKHNEKFKNNLKSKVGIRHLQAGMLFSSFALVLVTFTSMSVAIVAMTDQTSTNPDFDTFDWTEEQNSLILSSALWGVILMQIPIGYIIKKNGAHKFLSYGTILAGVISMLTPVAAYKGGWIAVLLCRFALGMAHGVHTPCVFNLMASWVPPNERSRIGSFIVNGASIGTVASMPISGVLVKSCLGWPSIFYIIGIGSTIWGILYILVGADTPSKHRWISLIEKEYIDSSLGRSKDSSEKKSENIPFKRIFKSVAFWSVVICNCGGLWCVNVYLSKMPAYFKYVLNFDIQESGILSALPFLMIWLLAFPISWLADYSIEKGVSVTVVRKVCTIIGNWGPALTLIILNLVESESQMINVIIFVTAVSLCSAGSSGCDLGLIDIAPNLSGTLVSFTNTVSKICAITSPIFVGFIVTDVTNAAQWRTIFYWTAAVYVLTTIMYLICGTAEKQSWDNQEDVINESPKNVESSLHSVSIISLNDVTRI